MHSVIAGTTVEDDEDVINVDVVAADTDPSAAQPQAAANRGEGAAHIAPDAELVIEDVFAGPLDGGAQEKSTVEKARRVSLLRARSSCPVRLRPRTSSSTTRAFLRNSIRISLRLVRFLRRALSRRPTVDACCSPIIPLSAHARS